MPRPLELRRLLRGRVARARRFSQITRIAIRHGLGPYLRGRRRAELDAPEELSFRTEATNVAGVAATADGAVRIPTPHEPLCSERVLVMQRLDGTPLGAAGPLITERALDRDALARQLLESMLRQIMLHGWSGRSASSWPGT